MDEKFILSNLEGMGYTKKESRADRGYTNKVIPIKMVDPDTGEEEIIDFYNGSLGYGDYKDLPEGFLAKAYAKSKRRQREIEEEVKWEESRSRYSYPDHWKVIPETFSLDRVFARDYEGTPRTTYVNYPNPEYEKFKEASFVSLVKALDFNRKKGLKEGKKTIQFPTIHPCRANDSKVFDDWTLGGFVSIPVSDEPQTFFQYQRVKYSKNPKRIYVILEGPEPKNNPDSAKYLIANSSKKDQDEYPEWVKANLLQPAEKEDM